VRRITESAVADDLFGPIGDVPDGSEAVIVCSCNVLTDQQIRGALHRGAPRTSQVYAGLGCSAQCGRCAHTIKRIMDEMRMAAAGPRTHAVSAST
jgi:bacterioferritin-associated ferredoxin